MGSSLGRRRAADLAFLVFGRSVHPDWYATRAHRRVAVDAWSADIRIIAGGHAITWRSGQVRLTEILGPRTHAWPEAGVLFDSPVRHEQVATLNPGSGVEYQTNFEVERLDHEVFAHLCTEMTLDAGRDRLFHRFTREDRLAPAAISHLAFESRSRGLLVHTFQSFPADLAIVRTQSLFEIAVSDRVKL